MYIPASGEIAVFLSAFVILMNLIVDLLYKVVDPRIDLQGGSN